MKKDSCVVTFIYKPILEESEIFSLKSAYNLLSQYQLIVVLKQSIYADPLSCVGELTTLFPDLEFLPIEDKWLTSIATYNKLLQSAWFYRLFTAYEYMLIVQTDAIVLNDTLKKWIHTSHSYIGSPWCGTLQGFTNHNFFVGVGNGGFSLRNVCDSIFVLENLKNMHSNVLSFREYLLFHFQVSSKNSFIKLLLYPFILTGAFLSIFGIRNTILYYSRIPIHEDVFWGVFVPRVFTWFSVPSPRIAASFALETNLQKSVDFFFGGNVIPETMGCHAWERYEPSFLKQQFHHRLPPPQ